MLASTHKWFSTDVDTRGVGRARIESANVDIHGSAVISTDKRGSVTVKLKRERVTPNSVDLMDIVGDVPASDGIKVNTPDGRFIASQVYPLGGSSFKTLNAELIVSNKQPFYWVLPLSNLLGNFYHHFEEHRVHPLCLDPTSGTIPFTWNGKFAYIEPLPDYKLRAELLQHGDEQNLVTAVMVGEIGECSIDVAQVASWFPEVFLYLLGFATGNEIGSPWIEFRDERGQLVKRVYRHLGTPALTEGRYVMEDITELNITDLLTVVQTNQFCQSNVYKVLLHLAMQSGASKSTVDDSLSYLFRAFDRLCQEYNFKTVFLRAALADPMKICALEVLNKAVEDIHTIAAHAGMTGDINAQKALERIAGRVKAADQTDRDFGTAVCMLAQRFGFQDEAAMDAHLAANPLSARMTTWRSMLSEYRNVNTHEAFHDTSQPAHALDKLYGTNLHLLDLLTRILLSASGYSGLYHPIAATLRGTQKPLDWVKADTPPGELGYNNLL